MVLSLSKSQQPQIVSKAVIQCFLDWCLTVCDSKFDSFFNFGKNFCTYGHFLES